MKDLPRGGLLGKLRRMARELSGYQIGIHAANTSYFLILSAFPALMLLLGLLRYTRLGPHDLVAMLEGILPAALLPEAELLIHTLQQTATASVVGLSALGALWSASRGVFGLLTGLNAIFGAHENRGYIHTRLLSLLYTFAFLLVLLLTLVLHVFGTGLLSWLQSRSGGFLRFVLRLVDLRFFLLLTLQTGLFTAMFTALPNRPLHLRDSLPGAFLSSSGWLIFSHLFSIYVENFSDYSTLYGNVSAMAVSMLWLYFCICILFYGGLLNSWLLKE